jgi:hypothetical protein
MGMKKNSFFQNQYDMAMRTEKKEKERFHSFEFNKGYGQHILKNPLIIQGIVEKVTPLSVLFSHNFYSQILKEVTLCLK